ncbi:hypothetical protein A3K29_05860 [Candidatus Collierbacteria bacterium RIFOXYB2_FULL_46_14]|uniref:DUF378 domain-containing protein n=1 Tax=Candidatus Collierbacteria bacterium GW2011_GWA2_46_26 TaxID=1618381 RepID=A0A0G1PHR9_9BACT|nr:MAG: hypothetical protein UX47_C0014G0004 [Candidatus Collierbacteria bacterium GW2011_GWA2_46_26]OGD73615.1 MAG: hypothetical protein A3K29_05860 [Candidatus Collierbacteria bacterium RIFOXYB2_FULL_46_14]OGD76657.1 MAG: hypothetical protein A3K43_05860 [Candidatus Collierbacteria bacterium RIFOXYA2_FULL_46_20]OGD77993.1 MAG: hypothetical protein A3K39_05860 [Candidatus Collierbacteria bacterium RIFOXYC2_FULL_43_15]OGD80017.1 MAG: hypothetical protein A2320_00290 [Pseudomonadales bacterium G
MMVMKHKIAYALVIVGALNWGMIGLFDFNLVSTIFGAWPWLEKLIYILVGLSAIFEAMVHMSYCKYCLMDMSMAKTTPMKKRSRR